MTAKPAAPALAFSYVRFSSAEQRKGDSLRRQTEAAADWCVRNNARLDASTTLHDLGKSAFRGGHRRNPDRNALATFLKLVEDGKVARGSYLIIESLDRLTREHIRPALTLLLNLIESGVRIVQLKPVEVIYDENVEPMTLMMALMELSRGNSESQVKSQRIGAAWSEKKKDARNGKQCPRQLPAWSELTEAGEMVLVPERAEAGADDLRVGVKRLRCQADHRQAHERRSVADRHRRPLGERVRRSNPARSPSHR